MSRKLKKEEIIKVAGGGDGLPTDGAYFRYNEMVRCPHCKKMMGDGEGEIHTYTKDCDDHRDMKCIYCDEWFNLN